MSASSERRIRETPLLDLYFEYLCGPLDRCWSMSFDERMLKIMFQTPFVVVHPRDSNRREDGRGLREEFLYYVPVKSSVLEIDGFQSEEVSVLEVLLALADRVSFQVGGQKVDYFAMFCRNLKLPGSVPHTKRTLRTFNQRTYSPDGGGGGLFPLSSPPDDQTKVELWEQMHLWIYENE